MNSSSGCTTLKQALLGRQPMHSTKEDLGITPIPYLRSSYPSLCCYFVSTMLSCLVAVCLFICFCVSLCLKH